MGRFIYITTVYWRGRGGARYDAAHFSSQRAAKVWAEQYDHESYRCVMTKYARVPFRAGRSSCPAPKEEK